MPVPRVPADVLRIYAAAFLRSLAVGMTGVLLAIYLVSIGLDLRKAAVLVSLGLAGAAAATLLASFAGDRFGRRRTLVVLGALNVLGAIALALSTETAVLMLAAFFGMINGLGRDRGPAYAIEQALLPETTTPERRTLLLAWYALVLDAGLALGSLLAGLPFLLRSVASRAMGTLHASYAVAWFFCAALLGASFSIYSTLSPGVEVRPFEPTRADGTRAGLAWRKRISAESRSAIRKLALLVGMDSLGGGFLSAALVSYWFFRRFHLSEEFLGPLFFAARVANALSHLAAAWLARRIGLLNTMVFTHIPSSLFLMAVPFAPDLRWAIVLFLLREGLVEMDVPTRQSYILAVVRPEERVLASGVTTLTRNVAYAVAPTAAGYAMKGLALASPLFLGAGIKIAYDVLLYSTFRRVKPPEERNGV